MWWWWLCCCRESLQQRGRELVAHCHCCPTFHLTRPTRNCQSTKRLLHQPSPAARKLRGQINLLIAATRPLLAARCLLRGLVFACSRSVRSRRVALSVPRSRPTVQLDKPVVRTCPLARGRHINSTPAVTMAFLFSRNRQRNNMDLVRSTKETLMRVAAEDKPQPKTEEDLARNLAQMKMMLQGTPGMTTSRARVTATTTTDRR